MSSSVGGCQPGEGFELWVEVLIYASESTLAQLPVRWRWFLSRFRDKPAANSAWLRMNRFIHSLSR